MREMETEGKKTEPLTAEEQAQQARRERARKGGIASGKARRKRKRLREYMEMVLTMRPEEVVAEQMEAAGMAPKEVCNAAAMTQALLRKALGGDVSAFREVRNLIGEDGDHSTEALLERTREILDGVVDGT